MTKSSDSRSNTDWPFVSIVIINSRGGDLFEEAFHSAKSLFYPNYEIVVEENFDRSRTIGKCWNDAVSGAKGEYVLFLGDDDRLSQEYLISLILYQKKAREVGMDEDVVGYSTYITNFDGDKMWGTQSLPTGMWIKEYLLENPFNEELTKHVDSEYFDRARFSNKKILTIPHNFGYYYRQHSEKVSKPLDTYEVDGKIVSGRRTPHCLYMVARFPKFAKELEEEMSKHYPVHLGTAFNADIMKDAHVVWCDWADEYAKQVSFLNTPIPRVLRVRAFDAFSPNLTTINFDAFEYVLFIAGHIKKYVEGRVGSLGKRARVIPNGVKLDKFKLRKGEQNHKVAWVGYLTNKKGVNLLLLAARRFPYFEFHVAGSYQEKDVEWYFNETKPCNVIYDGYQNDMNKFFQDKTYILNTSPREGNPNAVMEGMACGLMPLVYNWPGAEAIYGENVWRDFTELETLLDSNYEPKKYREFIVKNYNFKKCFEKYKYIVDKLWNKKNK